MSGGQSRLLGLYVHMQRSSLGQPSSHVALIRLTFMPSSRILSRETDMNCTETFLKRGTRVGNVCGPKASPAASPIRSSQTIISCRRRKNDPVALSGARFSPTCAENSAGRPLPNPTRQGAHGGAGARFLARNGHGPA